MGCGDATPSPEEVSVGASDGKSSISIYGGLPEEEAGASTVALKVGHPGKYELCSAALIAPNLALTARHCVGNSLTTTVSCDENGQSTNGVHVDGNQPASAITVYAGTSPKFEGVPDAVGKAIVSPSTNHFCDSDIALVVLDRPIANAAPLAVRLDGAVAPGETVRSIGYGRNDEKIPMGTRLSKPNVAVLAMGRGVSTSNTALGPHEFEVGRSICEGDSGGPAISETTGAVVGVVSRGSACSVDYGHIYTTTAGWGDLFAQAFAVAGGAPVVEAGGPPPIAIASENPDGPTFQAAQRHAGACSAAAPGAAGSAAASGTMPTLALALALATALASRRRRRH